ncbi:MAG: glycosyltransferase family 2 protein [Planctomycetota bacterium]|nr:glycosyltransferase family 2 protein [Planctomycetota bacterium]
MRLLPNPDVSILICTRNRSTFLRDTLASIATTHIPLGLNVEIIVVDNGSTDETPLIVKSCDLFSFPITYVQEPQKGLDIARNTGIKTCRGRVILLTDDDVRVPTFWIEPMCRPILNNDADAVAGGIEMASHLWRDWMQGDILVWRRIIADPPFGQTPPLIGANAAYSKKVFAKVPKFDEELDAGKLGLAGDILFSEQLAEAGFRISSAISKTAVVHHFAPDRLSRSSLILRARDQGRSDAYIAYHWLHSEPRLLRLRFLYRLVWVVLVRIRFILKKPNLEGLTPLESDAIIKFESYRGLLIERRRPRQYTLRGLIKISNGDEC